MNTNPGNRRNVYLKGIVYKPSKYKEGSKLRVKRIKKLKKDITDFYKL